MTNKRIIIKMPDGGVNIIIPAPVFFDPTSRDRIEQAEKKILSLTATEDEIIEWVKTKDVPTYRSFMGIKETEEEAKKRLGVKDLNENLPHRITDVKNISSDRTFRNAWHDNNPGEGLDVDMVKAREIHKEHLRTDRKPLLDALDLEFMRAVESGDTKLQKEISAKKQALRDITKHSDIDKAKTPEELKIAGQNLL